MNGEISGAIRYRVDSSVDGFTCGVILCHDLSAANSPEKRYMRICNDLAVDSMQTYSNLILELTWVGFFPFCGLRCIHD